MILSALLLEAMLSVVQLGPGGVTLPSLDFVASAQPARYHARFLSCSGPTDGS